MEARSEVVITSPVKDPRSAESLRRWLVRSGAVSNASFESDVAPPGVLGDPVAIVALIVSSVLALPAAIDAVRKWFDTQPPSTPSVTFKVGEVSVEISGDLSEQDMHRFAGILTAAHQAQQ
ncbi:effector-associated constant component EACC1 [Streptomyces sp. 3211.6]|uniref:effector-associated constant component EACC1 n=1 Tax=Streptomyces sp. 3211.6 TaxID=1938845 RepID=UPI001C9D8C01